ncbi:hypothetical protein PR048_017148 [Dryococelus australis]|uniref:DDE Tnp4 domain-containing protein n=1 Tax=Dryococelus australis TaxID=614101 RepID=A0ABQ9H8Q8_9NEOP|nr:hypothetical protein PR048_017148 [Dryococelus australis]
MAILTICSVMLRLCGSTRIRVMLTPVYLTFFFQVPYDREQLIDITTLRTIVKDTRNKLWICLTSTCIPRKTESNWQNIAARFAQRTDFPNCLGAVEGKHIGVYQPSHSGSQFSVIIMAVLMLDHRVVLVTRACSNVQILDKNLRMLSYIHLPANRVLPNDNGVAMPFVFVGDEAFALSEHVLRPYGQHNLKNSETTCRMRVWHSGQQWRILHRPLDVNIAFRNDIIKDCCILHNYVHQKDNIHFEDTLYESPLARIRPNNVRGSRGGITRHYFANYFTSPQGSVS